MKIQIGKKAIWINYHHLYCFYIIATEGSIAKASQKLGIGQSALSIQIKQFESSIGTAVFKRSHRKLTITETGVIILSYAKEIFRLGQEMIESLYDRPSPNRIHLQIGALDTIPKHLTLQLVETALKGKPCSVSILEGPLHELIQNLTDHKLDLLITNRLPHSNPGQVYTKRLARLPLWIVGGKSFLKLKKDFPQSLDGQPLVVPTADSSVRQELESFCKDTKINPDFIAEAQDVMVQKLLAQKEIGMTIIPELAVKEYLDKGSLFLIGKLDNCFEELFMMTASRKIENPVAAYLMKTFTVY